MPRIHVDVETLSAGGATARTGGNLSAAARAYQETDTTAMPR